MNYQYYTVDVFTNKPFNGAQITVFPHAEGLSDSQMQAMAGETNHSETVFLSPGRGDSAAELRVFSPQAERSVGSHTTVAAAYTLAHNGALNFTGDDCTVQLLQGDNPLQVRLRQSEQGLQTQLLMNVDPRIDRYVPDHRELQSILGLAEDDIERVKAKPLFVSCDSPYLIVPLRSLSALYRARYHAEAWAQSSASSVPVQEILLYCSETELDSADFHLRLLGPNISTHDDPPVGAAVSAFAAFLSDVQSLADGRHALSLERGRSSARQSLLQLEFLKRESAALAVSVGGDAVMVGEGKMLAP